MRNGLTFFTTLILVLFSCTLNYAQDKNAEGSNKRSIHIASWNIQDLGQSKNTEEIAFMANVLKGYDLVLIQEVVAKHPAGAQKVAELADELNRRGAKWDYSISNPTKSPSVYMSERYAFLWKTSKIDIIGRAYLDSELETKIYREPYIGKFKLKKENTAFYVVNFHSRKHDDQPELEIQYFKDYPNRLNSNNIIIAGDFNLNENHPVWNDLYNLGFKAALNNKKTTLKRSCNATGYLSHAIDNMYFSSGFSVVNSGIIDYIETCNNLEAARKISDHLPVFFQGHMNPN